MNALLPVLGVVLIVMGLVLLIPSLRSILALRRQGRSPMYFALLYWDAVGGAMAMISGILVVVGWAQLALGFFLVFLLAAVQRLRESRRQTNARRQAETIKDAVDHGEDSAEMLMKLGYWYREAGKLTDAEAALRQSVAKQPKNVLAHVNLGNVYYDTGRFEAAVAEYEKAKALDPENTRINHNIEMANKAIRPR